MFLEDADYLLNSTLPLNVQITGHSNVSLIRQPLVYTHCSVFYPADYFNEAIRNHLDVVRDFVHGMQAPELLGL